jgi:hypothetical protein
VGYLFNKLAVTKKEELEKIAPTIQQLTGKEQRFKRAHGDLKKTLTDLDQQAGLLEQRFQWVDIAKELRDALMRTEEATKLKFGTDTGIWVETVSSFSPVGGAAMDFGGGGAAATPTAPQRYGSQEMDEVYRRRYMPQAAEATPPPPPPPPPAEGVATTVPGALPSNSNQVAVIKISCRAVDRNSVNPGANSQTAYVLDNELKQSPLFSDVRLDAQITDDPTTGTFTFGINLVLKQPLKFAAGQ